MRLHRGFSFIRRHFICTFRMQFESNSAPSGSQRQDTRRFYGKTVLPLLPLPDKRCNSISKDYLVPSKVLCTLYQLQIYLGKFCSSFMNRARILKLPRKSNGPASFFPRTRSTRFFLRNLSTVFLSMLLFSSSSRHWYRLFPAFFARSWFTTGSFNSRFNRRWNEKFLKPRVSSSKNLENLENNLLLAYVNIKTGKLIKSMQSSSIL